MEQVLVCPQRIYKFSFPDADKLKEIKDVVINEEYHKPGTQHKSKDFFIHKREEYSVLFEWINKCVEEVKFEEVYFCDHLKISQAWLNKSFPGEETIPHWHANSVISGIFYFDDHEVPTNFAFRDHWYVGHPDAGQSYIKLSHREERSMIFHEVKSVSGDLILFPSTFAHGVEANYSEDNRYTLSFNTFPHGSVGVWEQLTGVRLDVD